jgi:protein Xni
LLAENIQIYDTFSRQFQSQASVVDKFGVNTEQLVRYWSLVGDNTNNIPGVNGIGPKSAHELLALGATLTEAVEHPDCHKKLREKILQNKEQIKIFMQILTLKTDVQLGLNLQDMRVGQQVSS